MATKKSQNTTPEHDLQVGDRVRIIIGFPGSEAPEGTIRVLQDEPGKKVGVELDRFVDYGHSLDLVLERERVDEERNVTVGKGWWTVPENVEKI